MDYERIAQTIEQELSQLVTAGENIETLRSATKQFEAALAPHKARIPFPQVVHYRDGAALRVSIMNGQPHALATAWVKVPPEWLS